MRLRFNEAKAAQAAARLLQLRGGTMSYMKLIKLLYLVDREAILRWGRPVTTDRHVSMDHGPVVSRIYDLIRSDPRVAPFSAIWQQYISAPMGDFEVQLLVSDPPTDELSRSEENLIAQVFGEHGQKNRWALVDYCHTLPEWVDPDGSALPIQYRDILQAGNRTDEEIQAVEDELESLAVMQSLTRT